MTAGLSTALTDPLGVVVDLVADVEPALDRAVIADVVEDVAGGRAKRRRLAQTLLNRPAVLADGRSPAPRVVGDLLAALRKSGRVQHLATGLRRLRQAPAQFPTSRRALVLRWLWSTA